MRKLLLSTLFIAQFYWLSAQNLQEAYCSHAKMHPANNAKVNENQAFDDYDVKFYFLDIEADNTSTYVKGKVSVTAQVLTEGMTQFVVELNDELNVDSVWVNGVDASYTHSNREVVVNFPSSLSVNNLVEVTFFYEGIPSSGGFFSGISNDFAGNMQVTWTLSEPLNALDWFPCKQVLTDKADSAYVFLTVPNHLKAGSNGLLTDVVELDNNRTRFEWKTQYPIAYYLLSMSIADYEEYVNYAKPEGVDSIMIQTFLYDDGETLGFSKEVLDQVPNMIELYSEKYGLYPFDQEKYGHCMAPMGGGAMEHQTMTTITNFNFGVTAHELGHQWFGDNVTCGSWRDIWVNEGFARYSEYLAYEFLRSKNEANNWIAGEYTSVMNQTFGSVYVPENLATDPNRIFNFRLTYQKGGAIIHMIRNILNDDELFFDVLKSYQIEHAESNATGEDIKDMLELKSGMQFDDFFNDWYYGEGYPSYRIEWNHYNDSLFIVQKQTTNNLAVDFFELPMDYKLVFSGSDSLVRMMATEKVDTLQIYMPVEVTGISVDPNKWQIMKLLSVTRNINLKGKPDTIDGIGNNIKNNFSIFPNPADNKLNIVNQKSDVYSFKIIDLKGQVLYQKDDLLGQQEINTSHFASGIYVLQISSKQKMFSQKIMID